MKNIGASVSAVLTHEKKSVAAAEEEIEEEECHWQENEMIFYLKTDPECQISAIEGWCENTKGEVVGSADICFRHIITGKRCDDVWDAVDGSAGFDTRWADGWETLSIRIEDVLDIEKIIRTERSVAL